MHVQLEMCVLYGFHESREAEIDPERSLLCHVSAKSLVSIVLRELYGLKRTTRRTSIPLHNRVARDITNYRSETNTTIIVLFTNNYYLNFIMDVSCECSIDNISAYRLKYRRMV